MKRNPEEFKQAAIDANIHKIDSHDCSLCGYTVGYLIGEDFENVVFDHGCYCTARQSISQRDWNDVANAYNMQTSDPVIERMDKFWRFK